MESIFENPESHYKVTFKRDGQSFLSMLGVIVKPFDRSLVSLLTREEIKIAEKYTGSRYSEFVHSRYITKRAVQQLMGDVPMDKIQLLKGVFEQPILEIAGSGAGYDASVAHKDDIAASLIFPRYHPAGIDIDVTVPRNSNTLNRLITEHEQQVCRGDSEKKMVIYTAKEALSKIIRCGLTVPVHFLEVNDLQKEEIFYCGVFTNFCQYRFMSFAGDEYIITMVFPRNSNCTIEKMH
ncbi:MAG TPA: 4'-phosphopantetheinyl transferase superfamily protein [Puia sp.]|nr:4'-phosphopantetheinyl transferase superfamily protein [Puia sp.]